MGRYTDLKKRQQEEVNAFPIAFAFSDKQFEEGMRSLGLEPSDADKVYSLAGTGGFYRRSDAPSLHEMFERHDRERTEAMEADKDGTVYLYDMFRYELANHEYGYTRSATSTLEALGLTHEAIAANPAMQKAFEGAVRDIIEEDDRR